MSDIRTAGEAEASALLRVDKVDGRTLFYRVTDGVSVEITHDEYDREGGA